MFFILKRFDNTLIQRHCFIYYKFVPELAENQKLVISMENNSVTVWRDFFSPAILYSILHSHIYFIDHFNLSYYIKHMGNKVHWRVMAHKSWSFEEKVRSQMKCCFFLMGNVKPGLLSYELLKICRYDRAPMRKVDANSLLVAWLDP